MEYSLCGSSVANLGQVACDKAKGIGKKIFIFNGSIGKSIYEAGSEAFLNKLVEYSQLSKNATNKLFVIPEIQEIANNSEANTTGTLGLGFTMTIREGKTVYNLKLLAGSDLLKRLRTFNNQTIRVYEYDSNNLIWGTKQGENSVGYQAKLYFTGGNMATGQAVEEGVIDATLSILSNSEYKDNSYWMDIDGNIEDVRGLNDVTFNAISHVTNVYKFGMKILGAHLKGGYDAFPQLGALIADVNILAFSGTNFVTSLPITSIAENNADNTLGITFDTTALGLIAIGANIKLVFPAPEALAAEDITNTEILPLVFQKLA